MSAPGTTLRVVPTAPTAGLIDSVVVVAVAVATSRARRGWAALRATGRRSAPHGTAGSPDETRTRTVVPEAPTEVEEGGARIYQLPVRSSTSAPVGGREAVVIPLRG